MSKYILANTIYSDGTGDFNHFVGIITFLKSSPYFKGIEFIPIVHFERGRMPKDNKSFEHKSGSSENYFRLRDSMITLMNRLNIRNYWYGNSSETEQFFSKSIRCLDEQIISHFSNKNEVSNFLFGKKMIISTTKIEMKKFFNDKFEVDAFFTKIKKERHANKVFNREVTKSFFQDHETLMKQAEQIIFISFDTALVSDNPEIEFYQHLLGKSIIKKTIFEHERQQSITGFKTFNMGLDNGCYGLKLLDKKIRNRKSAFETIANKAQDFSYYLKRYTGISYFSEFDDKNILVPAYFNKEDDFIALLDLLSINTYFSKDKNIVIYLSGIKKPMIIQEKLNLLMCAHSQNNTFHIEFYHHNKYESEYGDDSGVEEDNAIDHYLSESNCYKPNKNYNGPKIQIISGIYLNDDAFEAVQQLTQFAGVSGDNSLERCISMDILPFYWSTNSFEKTPTHDVLQQISQLASIEMTVEAREAFNNYFNAYKFCYHVWANERNVQYREKYLQESENSSHRLYSNLNIQAMIEAWPKITEHLRQHKNIYNKLDYIVMKDTKLDKANSVNQRKAMLAMTNAYGPGHFVPKNIRKNQNALVTYSSVTNNIG